MLLSAFNLRAVPVKKRGGTKPNLVLDYCDTCITLDANASTGGPFSAEIFLRACFQGRTVINKQTNIF